MKELDSVQSVIDRLPSPIPTSKIAILRHLYPRLTDGQLRGMMKDADLQTLLNEVSRVYAPSTVLVIGDTHAPFVADGYLEHCVEVYESQRCNRVIHIGDVVSNHRTSYHEDELDALSADEELQQAKEVLKPWADAFPDVDALYGNHDALIARKAKSGAISNQWIRPYNEVLGLDWRFHEECIMDGVLYRHVAGSSPQAASTNALKRGCSVVGGHYHTKAGVTYAGGGRVFGCLTGCGVDRAAYDQRYSTSIDPYVLSCAVVYNGVRAAVFPMRNET